MEFWRLAPTDLLDLQGTWQFMSTRLLPKPGKVHELCDDLESLWFVLLFEGLRVVKHNEPFHIDMALIFDQARFCRKTGTHAGGVGKGDLYGQKGPIMDEDLEFESKLFTVLIRQPYRLFQPLNNYYRDKDNKKTPSDFNQENFKKLGSCAVTRSRISICPSRTWHLSRRM